MPGEEKNNSQSCGGEEQNGIWLLPHGRKKPKSTHRSSGGEKPKQMGSGESLMLVSSSQQMKLVDFSCPFFCGFGFSEVWGWDGAAPWLLAGPLLLPSTLWSQTKTKPNSSGELKKKKKIVEGLLSKSPRPGKGKKLHAEANKSKLAKQQSLPICREPQTPGWEWSFEKILHNQAQPPNPL